MEAIAVVPSLPNNHAIATMIITVVTVAATGLLPIAIAALVGVCNVVYPLFGSWGSYSRY